MLLNVRIKRYLNDIIDYAYPNESEKVRGFYKAFFLYVSPEERDSRGAYYSPSEEIIVLHNIRHGNTWLITSAIHELAHRLQHCRWGSTVKSHGKEFYIEYEKLFYAALNMGILETDYYDKGYGYKAEQKKIAKWLEAYEPEPIDYKPDFPPIIRVYNSFSIKNELKEQKYSWNSIEMYWEKETDNIPQDTEYLKSIKCIYSDEVDASIKKPYFTVSHSDLTINPVVFIEAKGDTYKYREILKEYDFFFRSKGKKWIKKCNSDEYDKTIQILNEEQRLSELDFVVLKGRKLHK